MSDLNYDEKGASLREAPSSAPVESPLDIGHRPEPCTVVLFGVTGDLASRKLLPALYDLACHDVLPRGFTIVGYGRKPMTDDEFRHLSSEAIDSFFGAGTAETRTCNDVLNDVHYVQGEFHDPDGYQRLADALTTLDETNHTGNRIFYLATPPSLFPVIIERLGAAGLNDGGVPGARANDGGKPGWVRCVIEKPFGSDSEERPLAERRRALRVRRAPGLPHRPLPRQRDGAEHPGVPLRQRHLRADLEPPLHRPRADHRGRDASASSTAAPTTKRPARCAT